MTATYTIRKVLGRSVAASPSGSSDRRPVRSLGPGVGDSRRNFVQEPGTETVHDRVVLGAARVVLGGARVVLGGARVSPCLPT